VLPSLVLVEDSHGHGPAATSPDRETSASSVILSRSGHFAVTLNSPRRSKVVPLSKLSVADNLAIWQTCGVHPTERQLLALAKEYLASLLPAYIELVEPSYGDEAPSTGGDAIWELRASNSGYGQLLVEAKSSLQPRDVDRLHAALTSSMRQMMRNPTILIAAPWLSPRTREVLEGRQFSYLDLTGNVYVKHSHPAIYLRLHGADRDPNPASRERPPAGLHGPKARKLARLLVDYAPPFRPTDLAEIGHLNPGYVSRLLSALDDQAIIERGRRGLVEAVRWPELLVAAAAAYSLTKNNAARTFVAPAGAPSLYRRLAEADAPDVVVTGSFAASQVEAVAAPAQLVVYSNDPHAVQTYGSLLPADRGADVMILCPEDPAQLDRSRKLGRVRHIGLSQLVLDCIAGPGRLPQEGNAVLDWMRNHEHEWREPHLTPGTTGSTKS
jgi:hypothetical protein